jgi:decaprenylphospho-beta-D-ribofuranose 2-oxidase
MKLSGWGRYPSRDCAIAAPRDEIALRSQLRAGPAIARGNGRAYGDSALNEGNTISTRKLDRMLAFDAVTGQLVAEAGVLLGDVIAAFLPRGWFPPVTPGTKFVTLGGMIAADVHGKNHHCDGSFGSFVDWVEVMGADGAVRRAGPNDPLHGWTIGGMGLTGVILRAAIRLRPVETGWIRQETRPAFDLGAAMEAMEAGLGATYSVAWIDCLAGGASLGRSIVMSGEHATRDELPARLRRTPHGVTKRKLTVPLDAPGFALNGLTVKAFNALYYAAGRRKAGTAYVDWDSYFYPLDAILGWNRIYGRKGFVQFQCALPLAASREGLTALLQATARAGQGSFLAVLKRFGAQESRFSFPMEGYTLALDFPVRTATLALIERLDRITLDHGGRFYLAKDARMSAETFRAADPRVSPFTAMRAETGADRAFASAQSERLAL